MTTTPSASPVSAVDSDANGDDAENLAGRLRALADPTRLRLLALIAAADDAEACVCELTTPVGLAQPTVSHHLRLLVEAGFLVRSQRGRWAYYRLVDGSLENVAGRLGRTGRT